MIRIATAFALLFALAAPLPAQSIDELLDKLEAQRKARSPLASRVAQLEKENDRLINLVADLQKGQAQLLALMKRPGPPALALPRAAPVKSNTGPERPAWMKPYARATLMPDGSPIAAAASKWHQPGGLEGVKGWTSKLFRFVPGGQTWKENGVMKRKYLDGATFEDELSYQGVVFERRVRQKVDGVWLSEAIYRDGAARPPGYAVVGEAKCGGCHAVAGTAGVPGGDGVLSDRFSELE
jgi:hypothetical protein